MVERVVLCWNGIRYWVRGREDTEQFTRQYI